MKNACLMIILILITSFSFAEDFENIPKISVKGEALLSKEADQMEVHLGVLTRGKTSEEALQQNSQNFQLVLNHLKVTGLEEGEYQTGRFHIQPIYQRSSKSQGENDTVLGYEVLNSIKVKTLKIELADKILHGAVKAGANQIDQINFSLHKPQAYRHEVIQEAAQNALAEASLLAAAAGVKIKRVLSLSLNYWQNHPSPYMFNKMSAESDAGQIIEPGKAEIQASVNAIFEIEN